MRSTRQYILVVILFLFLSPTTYGQANQYPIDKWVKALSIKKDSRFIRFYEVVDDFKVIPKEIQCHALEMIEKEGPSRNEGFSIKYNYLKGYLDSEYSICADVSAEDVLKEALRMAYEFEDDILIAELNEYIGWHYNLNKDYNKAILHGLIAREMEEREGLEHFNKLADRRFQLGFALYQTHDFEKCLTLLKEALYRQDDPRALPSDSLDIPGKMFVWNTMGLCYLKLELYDSAFIAFGKALAVNAKLKNVFWDGLIEGNIGDTYFQMGKYDSAAIYLSKDIEQSIAAQEWDNAANSMQSMAQIKAKENPAEALALLRRASQYLQLRPQPSFLANTYYAYAQVFTALNKADSVNSYMQKYLTIREDLDKEVFSSHADILKMRMENQEGVYKINALNKGRQKILLIRNFSILLTLLVGMLGYMMLHRERLRLRLRQQQAIQQKLNAEAEVQATREQLKIFTENLLEKTQLVENLQVQLLQHELDQPPMSEEDINLNAILTEEDWEKFKHIFERVYPSFFNQLKQKAPDIPASELRMAALIRLKIPARKSATILGISQNSVYKTRQRLRNRLNLETDADLTVYFE